MEYSTNYETFYNYWDYFRAMRRKCRCRILDQRPRTILIELLEFGPKGKPPGTRMRVHTKSVDLDNVVESPDLSWHIYTDI